MIEQLNMPFGAERDTLDVRWFEHLIRNQVGWTLSGTVIALAGLPKGDASKRWIRGLAAQSAVILSGQKGYRHVDNATPEEIHHAAAWLESQAAQMQARAIRLRKAAHRKIHIVTPEPKSL